MLLFFFTVTCYQFSYESLYERMEMKIYTNEVGRMTKMATMPIYDKTLKIFSRTNGPLTMKLGVQLVLASSPKIVELMTLV